MQNALKKLFTNDGFFAAAAILGFAGEMLYGIVCCILYPQVFNWDIMIILLGICTLLLYLSYKKHSKNVMKALMGAALMAILCGAICGLGDPLISIDFAFALIKLVIILLLFANHLSINSEHRASPKKVFLNQILCILLGVLIIIWDICWIVEASFIIGISDIVGNTLAIASIVCVESRLDAYRLDREAAGWTEGKGYPEGYVHEWEKK